MANKTQPLSYSEWRKKQYETLVLPSGLEVKAKRVSLMTLAMNGGIPQTLNPFVADLVGDPHAADKLTLADMEKFGGVVNAVIAACVIEPPIAEESDETHLAVKDLDDADRMYLFNWANRGASQLQRFLPRQTRGVATAPNGNGNGHAPEPDVEPD